MNARRVFNGLIIALAIESLIEIIAGIVLAFKYSPNANDAYQSVKRIQSIPALNFLRGFHHWMSAVIIIAAGLTLLFGLVSAAYKQSSKKLWVSSVLLVVMYVLFQLTGHLLPWDQHAVRTAVVETGIAQSAPAIGGMQANLLRGGTTVSNQTLTIWFWAHVVGLSILWLFFSWIAWRKARANGFSRAIVIGGIVFDIAVAAALAFYAPVSFGNAAVSADYASFTARPEWYILPLHQLLVLFQRLDPSFAWVGTMVVPGIVLLLVLLAPWMDVRARRGQGSAYGPVFGVLLLVGGCALFAMGWAEMASPAGPNLFATEQSGATVKLDPKLVAQGETIFKSQDCLTCHSMNGASSGAPNLAGTGSRHPGVDWQVKHLMQPSSSSPGSTMPSYARLGQAKLKALASYLISLKG